jgi:hypothetical protein
VAQTEAQMLLTLQKLSTSFSGRFMFLADFLIQLELPLADTG